MRLDKLAGLLINFPSFLEQALYGGPGVAVYPSWLCSFLIRSHTSAAASSHMPEIAL
jgi:hypothetical protein